MRVVEIFAFYRIFINKKCSMGLKKEIIVCDIEGNELRRYNSAREASRGENISEDKVYKVLSGKKKSVNGYVFKKSGVYTNAVDKIGKGNYKCPYCEKKFETYNGLSKHVIKEKKHGNITKEKLLTDFKYNGNRPTCKCGCGEYTSINPNNEAHFCEYVYGHGIKVHNNWGHNKKAQENSAETRRRQYESGERIQWNKGKKWNETYDQETIERLKRNLSEKMNERIKNDVFTLTSKEEEAFINSFIKPLKIEYVQQYFLRDISQFCDIYMPSLNLIIEFDGDFWHCNMEVFKEGPQHDYQLRKIERDKIKNLYCERNNINILRIWENDVIHNKEKVDELIRRKIEECQNNEIYEYCCSLVGKENVVQRCRDVIKPKELDIYIPSMKVGIEYNGLRWHSDKYKTDKRYHYDKLIACKEKGIKLIQVFEDEYTNRKNIVLSKIAHLLGKCENLPRIMGRKCEICEIGIKEARDFLEKNHIQGYGSGGVHLGAYFDNNLVGVMIFRKEKEYFWELTRFATDNRYICVGVGGKLFNYFIKNYDFREIKSFADRRWTIDEEHNIYIQLGFKFDSYTSVEYRYFKEEDGMERQHKFAFRKERLHKKYGLPISMTESEMVKELGYSKVYDCGLIKYVFKKGNYIPVNYK